MASRDPALMEVSQGAAEHLDADDGPGWTQALVSGCTDPDWLLRLERRARAFRPTSWDDAAHRLFETVCDA